MKINSKEMKKGKMKCILMNGADCQNKEVIKQLLDYATELIQQLRLSILVFEYIILPVQINLVCLRSSERQCTEEYWI